MSDLNRIDQRLAAVERVVVDGDLQLDELADLASLAEDVERLETRFEEHERRLAELEAAVQSVEGYVGNVESVNDGVERQAASAVATVDRLEYRIEQLELAMDDVQGGVLADRETASSSERRPAPTAADTGAVAQAGTGSQQADEGEGDGAGGFEFGVEADPESEVSAIVDGEDSEPESTQQTGSSPATSPFGTDGEPDRAASDEESALAAGADESDESGGFVDSIRSKFS